MGDTVKGLRLPQNVVMDIPTTQVGEQELAKEMGFGIGPLYNVSEVCENTFLVIQRQESLQICICSISLKSHFGFKSVNVAVKHRRILLNKSPLPNAIIDNDSDFM